MAQRYSDQQVADALAALELNGGAIRATSREVGIPAPTLVLWRDRALAEHPERESLTSALPPKHDYADMWGHVQQVATARMLALIPISESLRDVAIAAGIAADKHLDYSQGRKGMAPTPADAAGGGSATPIQVNVQINYDYQDPRR